MRDQIDDALPLMGETDADSGLGDITSKLEERYQKYWDITRQNDAMPGQTAVAYPVQQVPPAMAPYVPAVMEILEWFKKQLECNIFCVKNPNLVEPTYTGIRLDKKTNVNSKVALAPLAGYPGNFTTVLSFQVPDLMVGIIWGIANLLEDDQDYEFVEWREQTDGVTLIDGVYRFQKADPTLMRRDLEPVPIIVPPLSTFRLQARNFANVQKNAVGRITGTLIPLKESTDDGVFGWAKVL
jgi:hypothetical protein